MQPLDLSSRPPRGCRHELDGILFLARNVDKARAALPGGALGPYFLAREDMPTLSALFFRRFGCTQDEFVAAVAAAEDDAAMIAWLRERADQEKVEAWNARLTAIHMRDLGEQVRTTLLRLYPDIPWDDDDLLVDVIEADDRRSLAATPQSNK